MFNSRLGGHKLAQLLGSWTNGPPTSEALRAAVRRLVLDGRLPPGTRLPAEREFADAVGASRTLVASTLDRLRDDGFVVSKRGAGSWVTLPCSRGEAAPGGGWFAQPDVDVLNLAQATPTAPAELFDAVERATQRFAGQALEHGYHPHGLPALRERIAQRFTDRGLRTDASQILVTSGAQHAFALIARLLVSPGQRVLVENPTYPNALEAIRAANATAQPVSMGAEGWDLELLEATLAQTSPRLAYLIPDFQNPTGLRMDSAARQRLAAALRRNRVAAVVDETLVDIDLSDEAAPPPTASFEDSHIVTIGSASKSFWGGLRLGWIRAPREFVQRMVLARAAVDLGSPVFEQLVLSELLDNGEEIRASRRVESIERRDRLATMIGEYFPQWSFRVPEGGLAIWCDLDAPISSRLAVVAEQHGVRLAAGARFAVHSQLENHLRLPYTLPVEQLRAAMSKLAMAAESLAPSHGWSGNGWAGPVT